MGRSPGASSSLGPCWSNRNAPLPPKGTITRALRVLVYGTIFAAGFVLLINTANLLLAQAVVLVVLVVLAGIGTLALYKPYAESTRVVAVAVALGLLVAALSAAELVLIGVPVGSSALP